MYAHSSDNGVTWSVAGFVNSNFGSDYGADLMPQVATDKNGGYNTKMSQLSGNFEHHSLPTSLLSSLLSCLLPPSLFLMLDFSSFSFLSFSLSYQASGCLLGTLLTPLLATVMTKTLTLLPLNGLVSLLPQLQHQQQQQRQKHWQQQHLQQQQHRRQQQQQQLERN